MRRKEEKHEFSLSRCSLDLLLQYYLHAIHKACLVSFRMGGKCGKESGYGGRLQQFPPSYFGKVFFPTKVHDGRPIYLSGRECEMSSFSSRSGEVATREFCVLEDTLVFPTSTGSTMIGCVLVAAFADNV